MALNVDHCTAQNTFKDNDLVNNWQENVRSSCTCFKTNKMQDILRRCACVCAAIRLDKSFKFQSSSSSLSTLCRRRLAGAECSSVSESPAPVLFPTSILEEGSSSGGERKNTMNRWEKCLEDSNSYWWTDATSWISLRCCCSVQIPFSSSLSNARLRFPPMIGSAVPLHKRKEKSPFSQQGRTDSGRPDSSLTLNI